MTHLVKFGEAIDHIGQGSTIIHAHVVYVLEAPDLCAGDALRHRLVPHVQLVVKPWDVLGCTAHDKGIHLGTQFDELDDRIALGLVLEVAHFSGVRFSCTST